MWRIALTSINIHLFVIIKLTRKQLCRFRVGRGGPRFLWDEINEIWLKEDLQRFVMYGWNASLLSRVTTSALTVYLRNIFDRIFKGYLTVAQHSYSTSISFNTRCTFLININKQILYRKVNSFNATMTYQIKILSQKVLDITTDAEDKLFHQCHCSTYFAVYNVIVDSLIVFQNHFQMFHICFSSKKLQIRLKSIT